MIDDAVSTTFAVEGVPRPQGSLTPWADRNGKAHVTHGLVSQRWRLLVHDTAVEQWQRVPLTGPVGIRLLFRMPERLRDFTGGYPTGSPDVDKLARCVLDGLTGVVYVDDAQVVRLMADKCYARAPYSVPGVVVTVDDWSREAPDGPLHD